MDKVTLNNEEQKRLMILNEIPAGFPAPLSLGFCCYLDSGVSLARVGLNCYRFGLASDPQVHGCPSAFYIRCGPNRLKLSQRGRQMLPRCSRIGLGQV